MQPTAFFSSINKKNIIQAVGLMENYKEDSIKEKFSFTDPHCNSCSCRAIITNFSSSGQKYRSACQTCRNCPYKNIEIKDTVKYVNERNRYGFRAPLKVYGLKLYLYMYFISPTADGCISFNSQQAAEYLHCTERTVLNNIRKLCDDGYIISEKTSPHHFNIMIDGYIHMYDPAKEGGRGYYTMSLDMLQELFSCNTIVMLRMYLRALLELDSPSTNGIATAQNIKLSQVRRWLPHYCKPGCIRKHIEEDVNSVIQAKVLPDNIIRFELSSQYAAHNNRERLRSTYYDEISNYIIGINSVIIDYNAHHISLDERYQSLLLVIKDLQAQPKLIRIYPLEERTYELEKTCIITHSDLHDFSDLALDYGLSVLIQGFNLLYRDYICRDIPISNPGGLLRSYIKKLYSTEKTA